MTTVDAHLHERAREMLDARLAVIDRLAGAAVAVRDARTALDVAEREEAAAYAAASKAGWTDDELRRLGLARPARRTPGRPRQHARTPEVAAANSEPELPEM